MYIIKIVILVNNAHTVGRHVSPPHLALALYFPLTTKRGLVVERNHLMSFRISPIELDVNQCIK